MAGDRAASLPMSRQLIKSESVTDSTFAAEWEDLAPERDLAVALIRYRCERGLSQAKLAEWLGTSLDRVADLESGEGIKASARRRRRPSAE